MLYRIPSLLLGAVLSVQTLAVAGAEDLSSDENQAVVVHLRGAGPTLKHAELSARTLPERIEAVRAIVAAATDRLNHDFGPSGLVIEQEFRLQPAVAVTAPSRVIRELARRSEVERVEPDYQWRVHTAEGRELIGATEMYRSDFTGDGTAVAVIDTGIDYLHPVLGAGSIPNPKIVRGLDTGDHDDDPMDCGSHGTAVAAVAVGSSYQWNPSRWFAGGVAPQARLLAYKASPDSQCGAMSTSAVVAAIEDALLHREGPDYRLAAINISAGSGAFTGPCDDISLLYSQAVSDAVDLGVTVVASSGNDGETNAIAAPACFSDVLSVGAFWDQAPGWTGYSFCLDASCERYCNDSFQPEGSVTCYTNLSSYLDVVAPSEYLTTARAGGQTLEFGGTSGAAPYVSGAIALLREAAPTMSPDELRIRLALTGRRRVDERTGRVVPAIRIDEAHRAAHLAIGPSGRGPDPTTGGVAVSAARVDHEVVVGAVRVLVHLAHDAPERLQVTVVSPTGTRVLLHDGGPGTSERSIDSFGGLYALYPDDVVPADSLARFHGEPGQGLWSLEVLDPGSPGPLETPPQILGWGLEIEPWSLPGQSSSLHRVVVPVVADSSGIHGTRWLTDLRVHAPGARDETAVDLFLVPTGADGSSGVLQTALRLPAGRIAALTDLVSKWFGVHGVVGSLVLEVTGSPLQVSSRTYNSTSVDDGGTFGQFIGAVQARDAISRGDPALHAIFLADTNAYRSNLGLVEVGGASASAVVTLFDGATGEPLASPQLFEMAPFSHLQVNRILHTVGGAGLASARASVLVVGGSGRVAAYSSIVDNRTGDAAFEAASPAVAVEQIVVPVVARTSGVAGTRWASDVRIANLGARSASLDLELRWDLAGEARTVTRRVEIPAATVAVYDDVVGTLLGLESAVGSLRIVPVDGPTSLRVASRTYNQTSEGTFGQAVQGVLEGSRETVEVLHLDGHAGWRSNLGLCEVSGRDAVVTVELFDGNGARIGEPRVVELAPFELVQIDRIHHTVGAPPIGNCRAEIRHDGGEGTFVAYGSVVDGLTGDAIWVPGISHPS